MTMNWDERGTEMPGHQQNALSASSMKDGTRAGEAIAGEASFQMMALELENLRLTRLVAELLMKNQQLREKALLV